MNFFFRLDSRLRIILVGTLNRICNLFVIYLACDPDDDYDEYAFECGNGQCIRSTFVCDGNYECEDWSDEYPESAGITDL